MDEIDRINRRTWRTGSSLRLYGKLEGWFDEGERVALAAIEQDIRGKSVLDLGVGGGRTAGILGPLAASYIGVDYTPEMVEICRRRFPHLTFQECDARDLSRFGAASFDAIVFSCNAIDSVDADGRRQVLSECARVLAPGGTLYYSTFNRDGPGFRDRANNRSIELSRNPARVAYSAAKYAVFGAIGRLRVLKNAALERRTEDYSILLHKAHDFGILVYAATLPGIEAELRSAGLARERIFGVSGAEISGDRADGEEYFHVIARKP